MYFLSEAHRSMKEVHFQWKKLMTPFLSFFFLYFYDKMYLNEMLSFSLQMKSSIKVLREQGPGRVEGLLNCLR